MKMTIQILGTALIIDGKSYIVPPCKSLSFKNGKVYAKRETGAPLILNKKTGEWK